jgi:L-serine dehydratase
MSLSVFDIFKIGIGPSSSHTMGPMNAARSFVELLAASDLLSRTSQVSAQLYGSLALTGRGHCTDRAILLGLEGMSPDTIDSAAVEAALHRIRVNGRIRLAGRHEIAFDEPLNLLFHMDQVLPGHSNGMRFTAHDSALQVLARSTTASAAASSFKPAPRPMSAPRAARRRSSSIPARACSNSLAHRVWKFTS